MQVLWSHLKLSGSLTGLIERTYRDMACCATRSTRWDRLDNLWAAPRVEVSSTFRTVTIPEGVVSSLTRCRLQIWICRYWCTIDSRRRWARCYITRYHADG